MIATANPAPQGAAHVALLRLPAVVARTGLSKSTIWKRAGEGTFPKPVKLSDRCTAWVESEVDQWAHALIAARA